MQAQRGWRARLLAGMRCAIHTRHVRFEKDRWQLAAIGLGSAPFEQQARAWIIGGVITELASWQRAHCYFALAYRYAKVVFTYFSPGYTQVAKV